MGKNVKLVKLELTNYRNIDYAVYEFDGNSKIVGENRIGKTNTLEAIYWLLTDKLLNGSSDVSAIKNLKDTKAEVRVEATFDVDGQKVTLKKEYGENWVRTRGTADLEFKGHYNTYYHNGVKQGTVKAYTQLVYDDFGITAFKDLDVMRVLIDPVYIGELGESKDWSSLRTFIIDLIGDVKDDDVFLKEPKLKPIQDDLAGVNGRIDQLKKQYKGSIDGLNDTIIGNNAQIQMLEETEHPTEDEYAMAKSMVDDLNEQKAKLTNQQTGNAMIPVLERKIMEKKNEINEAKIDVLQNNPAKAIADGLVKEHQKKLEETYRIKDEIRAIENEIERYTVYTKDQKAKREGLSKEREQLLAKYHELDEMIKNPPEIKAVCPTCGRPLENADEVRAETIAQWAKEKSEVLEKGKKLKTIIDGTDKDIAASEEKVRDLESKLETKKTELENANAELDAIRQKKEENEKLASSDEVLTPHLETLNTELKDLETQLDKIKADDSEANQVIRQQIADLEEKAQPYQDILSKYGFWKTQQLTLERKRAERAANEKTLAGYEQKRELLNKFIFVKLQLLDEKVSRVFGNIKFQLIKENINGGFDPICKPYIYDIDKDTSTNVSWRSGSKSERIVTGIAIAERIKTAMTLPNLPFLFDEGGEISSDTFATKFKTESQLICVKVQDNIKKPIVLKI